MASQSSQTSVVGSPSSDTESEVQGTKDVPGADMNDEGQIPTRPKRRKRNNGKRDDS